MNKQTDTLCKVIYFMMTICVFSLLFLLGYICMYLISYIYELHPYITLIYYIFLYLFDRFLTIRIMKSQLVLFWIRQFKK